MNDILLNSFYPAMVKALEVNPHEKIPLLGRMPRTTIWKEAGGLAVRDSLYGGGNALVWSFVVVYVFLTQGFGYFQFMK